MMIPTVHINGTGKKNLLQELEYAVSALVEAISEVSDITVHGRDYYVQGPEAYAQARIEMHERIAALEKVKRELEEMHGRILAQ